MGPHETGRGAAPPGRWIAVVSDFVDGPADRIPGDPPSRFVGEAPADGPLARPLTDEARAAVRVTGGYLERLPLACLRAGHVDAVEIWHHWRGETPPPPRRESAVLTRRAFRLDGDAAPFASRDMIAFVDAYGPPAILLVLGLGIDEAILRACRDSLVVYNSIDAPALRVPDSTSRHFDLVITGAAWQSRAVEERHPGMPCTILPIGPEFADPDLFRPLGGPKDYDVIYVAAAQPYKRHDILFDALALLPRSVRALCVFGYGEMADAYRREAAERGLSVDFVGPPGVPFDEVNRLMNRARIGVVCGVDDGAPAILTEYALAGLPVLANERLSCGLQFVTPETGLTASAESFADAILHLAGAADRMDPRRAAGAHWAWPSSVVRFGAALAEARRTKDEKWSRGEAVP